MIAAIIYETESANDERLGDAVAACRAAGLNITGLVQHNQGDCAQPGFIMTLEDIASGGRISITETSITCGHGCRLDAGGLAEAAATLHPDKHQGSDLVVVNKFGRQEAAGRGLRDEIAAIVAAGLPILTSVRSDFIPAFEEFVGPDWVRLEPETEAIMAWVASTKALAD